MALTRITKGVIKPNENYDTHDINSTGIVTTTGLDVNGNADISGSLLVGGVLTYEDVTSIDSVGIITARTGLVSPYADIDDFVSIGSNIHLGNAGVVTATSFVGDGSGLIGVASTDNIVTGTAATFNNTVDINGDLDVDGHTNLDNVSIAGVTTFASNVFLGDNDRILFGDGGLSDAHVRYDGNHLQFGVASGQFRVSADTSSFVNYAGSQTLATINSTGVSIPLDLDVDGHTNLDNVSIAGVSTFAGTLNASTVSTTALIASGDLDVDGHTNLDNVSIAGVVTATTFSGSGASLTNLNASAIASGTVPTARLGSGTANSSTFLRGDSTFAAVTSTTINNNANNRIITGSGTANTLEGEATLTYDGTSVFELQPASATPAVFVGDSNRTGAGEGIAHFKGNWNGTTVARITIDSGSDTTNKDDGIITFATAPAGSLVERLRIPSGGGLAIGTASPTRTPLHVHEPTTATANIHLTNSSSGSGATDGLTLFLETTPSAGVWFRESGALRFATGNTERFRIDANGNARLGPGGNNTNSTNYSTLTIANTAGGVVEFMDSGNNNIAGDIIGAEGSGMYISSKQDTPIIFRTGATNTENMRITSGTAVEIGSGTGTAGRGLAIYGGTNNNVSGQDAVFYVRGDTNSDWGMILQKTSEYGFRMNTSSAATLSFAIYDQSNNLKHQFKGNGDYTAQGYVDSASDIKLKTNIKTIDNALDKVLHLRGAEYDRIDKDNQHEIGVIAQEVEKVIPELVHGDETKTVSYGNMTAVLIEAIKEQNDVINKMKKEIEDLKG